MVAPQHDDRVVSMWTCLQGVQHTPDHRISVGDAGELILDTLPPLPMLLDVCQVAIPAPSLTGGWEVVEVSLFQPRGHLHLVEREQVEVLLRHVPRLMRTVDATCEEKRLLVLGSQLLVDPAGDEIIAAELFVAHIERRPIRLAVLPLSPAW